jgi:hypothetical protein
MILRKLGVVAFILLTGLAVWLAYRYAQAMFAEDLYRQRISALVKDYESLRSSFNAAVKKTAVTELLVNDDGSICVVFVNMDGSEVVQPTKFRMGSEVFVDFVVIDGRLFLRRVFDENTKPSEALVINPELQKVEWQSGKIAGGSAPYTQINKTGRWVVNVNGTGALEIRHTDEKAPRTPLVATPAVKDFSTVDKELDAQLEQITAADVLKSIFGGK